ncbi:MAG: hypothetical protein SGPRY_006458 [Prymnesium sp.]
MSHDWVAMRPIRAPDNDKGVASHDCVIQTHLPLIADHSLITRPRSQAIGVAIKQPMPVEVRRSAIHNWGLFTTRPVRQDGVVVEYKGRELRNKVADRKEKWYEAGAIKGQGGDCYMFRLDEERVLDATTCGNVARFMNHCCTPNCYCKVVEIDGRKRIVVFAQRDLEAGEEVTYDYKFPTEKAKIPCHCGSPKCLGVMN